MESLFWLGNVFVQTVINPVCRVEYESRNNGITVTYRRFHDTLAIQKLPLRLYLRYGSNLIRFCSLDSV